MRPVYARSRTITAIYSVSSRMSCTSFRQQCRHYECYRCASLLTMVTVIGVSVTLYIFVVIFYNINLHLILIDIGIAVFYRASLFSTCNVTSPSML